MELTFFIENIKKNPKLNSFDEVSTKQAIILPILQLLGWNTYDIEEVAPEFPVDGRKVDYCLRLKDASEVFIEVKRIGTDLDDHEKQLLDYSFKHGVELATLTNGIMWIFYLPTRKGDWKTRRFYSIDIIEQEASDVSSKFTDLLSKDSIRSGKAVEHAESIYKSKLKTKAIKATLPEAWNKVITDPDNLLINLLLETTEKLCGFKPDVADVNRFLENHKPQFSVYQSVEDNVSLAKEKPIEQSDKGQKKYEAERVLRKATPETKEIFSAMRARLLGISDTVWEKVGQFYFDYRTTITFASIVVQKSKLRIFIKMGDQKINDPQKKCTPIPSTWGYGLLNTQFEISKKEEIEYSMKLIMQAYNYVQGKSIR